MIPDPMTRRGTPPSPYAGFRPYGTEDRPIFFGRSAESADLAGLWRGHRLTLLHGASGAGKTSLLRAGALPLVRAAERHVLPVGGTAVRTAFPTAALPEQNPHTFALLTSWSPGASPIRLAGLSIGAFLRRSEAAGRSGSPGTTFAAIDQMERIFRGPPAYHTRREEFLAELFTALAGAPRTHLLIAVRSEWLPEIAASAERHLGGSVARFGLGPLGRDAAIEAATRPLEGTGHAFAPGAAERLVDELGDAPGARTVDAALLQMACHGLWESRGTRTHLLTARPGPDVDRALAISCAHALTFVAAGHGIGREALTARLARHHPGGLPASAARALEDLHLIRLRRRNGTGGFDLRHPRLAGPLRQVPPGAPHPVRPDPPACLDAAALALSDGDHALARYHAERAARLCRAQDLRLRAEIESFLGDVAHEQDLSGPAAAHYRAAARLYETLQDPAAVARSLTAVGRLTLARRDGAMEAVEELWSGAGRAPNEPTLQTVLGQALYQAGQPQAALAVLGSVLGRHGDTPEALRARGEILADLGESAAALRDLDRVETCGGPSMRAARALALAAGGRLDAAQREIRGLAEEGASGPLLWRVARVKALSGDHDTAVRLAARALAAEGPSLAPRDRRAAADLVNTRRRQPGRGARKG